MVLVRAIGRGHDGVAMAASDSAFHAEGTRPSVAAPSIHLRCWQTHVDQPGPINPDIYHLRDRANRSSCQLPQLIEANAEVSRITSRLSELMNSNQSDSLELGAPSAQLQRGAGELGNAKRVVLAGDASACGSSRPWEFRS